MALIDLSSLTDAQLATELSETLAEMSKIRHAQSYSTGARSLNRAQLRDLAEYLGSVSAETTRRGQTLGPVGIVEFEEPI